MSKLFVYGVDPACLRETLEGEFGRCGEVIDVYNTKKGYAFVTMADSDGADQAIRELNGTVINGQEIKVDNARGRGGGTRNFSRRQESGMFIYFFKLFIHLLVKKYFSNVHILISRLKNPFSGQTRHSDRGSGLGGSSRDFTRENGNSEQVGGLRGSSRDFTRENGNIEQVGGRGQRRGYGGRNGGSSGRYGGYVLG